MKQLHQNTSNLWQIDYVSINFHLNIIDNDRRMPTTRCGGKIGEKAGPQGGLKTVEDSVTEKTTFNGQKWWTVFERCWKPNCSITEKGNK